MRNHDVILPYGPFFTLEGSLKMYKKGLCLAKQTTYFLASKESDKIEIPHLLASLQEKEILPFENVHKEVNRIIKNLGNKLNKSFAYLQLYKIRYENFLQVQQKALFWEGYEEQLKDLIARVSLISPRLSRQTKLSKKGWQDTKGY